MLCVVRKRDAAVSESGLDDGRRAERAGEGVRGGGAASSSSGAHERGRRLAQHSRWSLLAGLTAGLAETAALSGADVRRGRLLRVTPAIQTHARCQPTHSPSCRQAKRAHRHIHTEQLALLPTCSSPYRTHPSACIDSRCSLFLSTPPRRATTTTLGSTHPSPGDSKDGALFFLTATDPPGEGGERAPLTSDFRPTHPSSPYSSNKPRSHRASRSRRCSVASPDSGLDRQKSGSSCSVSTRRQSSSTPPPLPSLPLCPTHPLVDRPAPFSSSHTN